MESIKVVRKHAWVAVGTLPLTEEEAHGYAVNKEPIKITGELKVSGPICLHCEVDYGDALESCPGDPEVAG